MFANFLIHSDSLYRVSDSDVFILCVLHQRQDVARWREMLRTTRLSTSRQDAVRRRNG
jgi:hypothetical protein